MRKTWTSVVAGAALWACMGAWAADLPHWSYAGEDGPAEWARLTPENATCAGRNQSPINLVGFIHAQLKPIHFAYQAGGTEILNNGHTVQVNYAPGSSITLDGTVFELTQFHFHAPSENQIRGKSYALEGHLVHADKDGNLAVVAVMFREGAANKALAKIWPLMPTEAGAKTTLPQAFAAAGLLPANRAYYRFSGSLTTPPCSEGVRWLVMKAPVSASAEQIEAFTHAMHHPNNRPVQAVNGRTVLE
nr:carbonic anhydrase family protein [uncultured Albidiferax sp.]